MAKWLTVSDIYNKLKTANLKSGIFKDEKNSVSTKDIKSFLVSEGYIDAELNILPKGEEIKIFNDGYTLRYPEKILKIVKEYFGTFDDERLKEYREKEFIPTEKRPTKKTLNSVKKVKKEIVFEERIITDDIAGFSEEDRIKVLRETLKKYYGEAAEYRDGQLEAIDSVLMKKRTLVVQKTGWGKSLVYFMATKMIRQTSDKLAIIISPLLALMDNQVDSATKLNLNVNTINSQNEEEWPQIFSEIDANKCDALIVSPERLANEKFKKVLAEKLAAKIGLFVVDEAHCISDWGHDFRPDYRRIIELINMLPPTVPVLATTATANDRVIEDVKAQLGQDLIISRGELLRESIAIDTINIKSREERMAWLVENIPNLPGSGVVYCLTVNDCISVSEWLNSNGIKSAYFHGRLDKTEKMEPIDKFIKNEIKVLVATVAFGMGYDKPDIGFVIHFQKPKDVIGYYQQIGRAGRALNEAYAIMLYGDSDDVINRYFIDNAFPSEEEMQEIIDCVSKKPSDLWTLEKKVNIRHTSIEKVVKYLEVEGDIYFEKKNYHKSARPWKPDLEKSRRITERRYRDLDVMNQFARTDECYMEFIARELDDSNARKCGKCANCIGKKLFGSSTKKSVLNKAIKYSDNDAFSIKPRAEWPNESCNEKGEKDIEDCFRLQPGIVMCAHEDSAMGKKILSMKENGEFSDEMVDIAYKCIRKFVKENRIKCLTYVPSIRYPELVRIFAERLADKLNIEFFEALEKVDDGEPQETFQNSYKQWENANETFEVVETRKANTLLVDDTVRSRWTLTCCGYKMLKAKNGSVYPFALVDTGAAGEKLHDVFR